MIKLKFALSLSLNSKNQTQNPPHNGCPLHLGGNWRRGSISQISLASSKKIKEQIEPLIILMQWTSQSIFFFVLFFNIKIMFNLFQMEQILSILCSEATYYGAFQGTHQHLLTYQREIRDYDLLTTYQSTLKISYYLVQKNQAFHSPLFHEGAFFLKTKGLQSKKHTSTK